jgi:UDP-N-acetylglucosamine acyltransferase
VHVGDWAILGGFTGVHQFVRIGAHSITAMGTILQDLPPFVMAAGNPAEPRSINAEGLKRRGYSSDAVAAVKRAFKTLYKSGLRLDEARAAIEAESGGSARVGACSRFSRRARARHHPLMDGVAMVAGEPPATSLLPT